MASAAGELLDIEFAVPHAGTTVDEVLGMERLKTAAYSFEAPLQAGAVLAGASTETVAGLGEVGHSMGIAYQIADDLLGVFGHPSSTGKSTLGDLREGKMTVLTAHASTQPQWPAISEQLGNPR